MLGNNCNNDPTLPALNYGVNVINQENNELDEIDDFGVLCQQCGKFCLDQNHLNMHMQYCGIVFNQLFPTWYIQNQQKQNSAQSVLYGGFPNEIMNTFLCGNASDFDELHRQMFGENY